MARLTSSSQTKSRIWPFVSEAAPDGDASCGDAVEEGFFAGPVAWLKGTGLEGNGLEGIELEGTGRGGTGGAASAA